MKTRMLIIMATLVASIGVSRADIIDYNLADDGDGVITCSTPYGLEQMGPGSYQLSIYGDHNIWGSGHIAGYFTTDTPTDPTLALSHSIDNDTAFDWGDYHVKVTMSQMFSFSNVNVSNSGWWSSVTAPTMVGSDWIGYIDYYSGTPVLIGGTLDFGFSVSFAGSVSFAEELTPSAVVPEPSTFALMAVGLAGLFIRCRRVAS